MLTRVTTARPNHLLRCRVVNSAIVILDEVLHFECLVADPHIFLNLFLEFLLLSQTLLELALQPIELLFHRIGLNDSQFLLGEDLVLKVVN